MTDLDLDSVAIRAGRSRQRHRPGARALGDVDVRDAEPSTPPVACRPCHRAEQFYSRYGNPTVKAFEDAIAELEGAEAARAFASGMGATASVVFAPLLAR